MTPSKIMAISSGGGHWVQLMRLKPAFDDLHVVYVSVDPTLAVDVPGRQLRTVRDATRASKLALIIMTLQVFAVLLRERPGVVITTGAAPGLIALVLAKYLLRSRTIWIDSIANGERLSGSGRQAGRFADVWLTQWSHLATPAGPQFWGAVL
jgi:UDP-N-acetylglucosamine:LPS N-acetylglucosamine transferase